MEARPGAGEKTSCLLLAGKAARCEAEFIRVFFLCCWHHFNNKGPWATERRKYFHGCDTCSLGSRNAASSTWRSQRWDADDGPTEAQTGAFLKNGPAALILP